MNINIKYFGIRQSSELDERIENRLREIEEEVQIDEANLRLACYPEVSPSFQVFIHIVTPGPDLFVTGLDHTLPAALEKALKHLRVKIANRKIKHSTRTRSGLSAPTMKTRPRPMRVFAFNS